MATTVNYVVKPGGFLTLQDLEELKSLFSYDPAQHKTLSELDLPPGLSPAEIRAEVQKFLKPSPSLP